MPKETSATKSQISHCLEEEQVAVWYNMIFQWNEGEEENPVATGGLKRIGSDTLA